jgi:hypothetical protein
MVLTGSTPPVSGSVPSGRRNNRMCGSGLCTNFCHRQKQLVGWHTCGWHNAPSPCSAALLFLSIHPLVDIYPSAGFSRAPWEESHACMHIVVSMQHMLHKLFRKRIIRLYVFHSGSKSNTRTSAWKRVGRRNYLHQYNTTHFITTRNTEGSS